jgi:hypothetical protein
MRRLAILALAGIPDLTPKMTHADSIRQAMR